MLRFAECHALKNEVFICDGDRVCDSDGNSHQICELHDVRERNQNGDSLGICVEQQRRVPALVANELCELNDSSERQSIPADAFCNVYSECVFGRDSDYGQLAIGLGCQVCPLDALLFTIVNCVGEGFIA